MRGDQISPHARPTSHAGLKSTLQLGHPCYRPSQGDLQIVAQGARREPALTSTDPVRPASRMFGFGLRASVVLAVQSGASAISISPQICRISPGITCLLSSPSCFSQSFGVDWGTRSRAGFLGYRGQIVLFMMGGSTTGEYEKAHRWQRIAIWLGGPAAGFLLWYLTYLFKFNVLPRIDPARANLVLSCSVDLMLFETLLWNAMNLLPVIPLDLGEVMCEMVTGLFASRAVFCRCWCR